MVAETTARTYTRQATDTDPARIRVEFASLQMTSLEPYDYAVEDAHAEAIRRALAWLGMDTLAVKRTGDTASGGTYSVAIVTTPQERHALLTAEES